MRLLLSLLAVLLLCLCPSLPANAQDGTIEVEAEASQDGGVEARLQAIFAEIEALSSITPTVQAGVVTLSGDAPNDAAADRALDIARRVSGVVAVEDDIARTLDVSDNVTPVLGDLRDDLRAVLKGLPLYALALGLVVLFALLGSWLVRRKRFWDKVARNPFLGELLAQLARLVLLLIGIVAALNIVGATALIGGVLGGAGILGIAFGFGIRDTVENYVSSLLLSIRQPFRAQDHVVIDGEEGVVIRLTTRATILMTLDGNHLRIPNAKVFKANILNYTTNPERRFTFDLGVDSADDPVAAIATGTDAIAAHGFVLDSPAPSASIVDVGDSSIVIQFTGWINQTDTGFAAARSQAIRDAKDALEKAGFSLPEPLYRLRIFDGDPPASPPAGPAVVAALDTAADHTVAERFAKDSEDMGEPDLLSEDTPVE